MISFGIAHETDNQFTRPSVANWRCTVIEKAAKRELTFYRAFCERMVKQFGENADDTIATHTLKACLLQPGMIDIARLPVAVFVKRLDDGTTSEGTRHFRWGLRGLVALRSGELELAVKHIGQAEELKPTDLSRALNLSVLALAQHELQHPDEAKATPAAVAQLLTQIKKAPGNKVHHDLLIAEILFREAEAKISGQTAFFDDDQDDLRIIFAGHYHRWLQGLATRSCTNSAAVHSSTTCHSIAACTAVAQYIVNIITCA